MRCGELGQDTESLAKVRHDLRGELQTTVTNNGVRESMILPDMEEVQFGGVQNRDGLVAQDELSFFGELINNRQDGVETVREG